MERCFEADARDHAQVAAMVDAVEVADGPVDVAIHNATISFPRARSTPCRVLARELGPHGVRVNVVAPGLTDTDATAPQPPEMKQAVARATPLRRVGQPRDLGGVVAFLCSEEARWITGQYLALNGGLSSV